MTAAELVLQFADPLHGDTIIRGRFERQDSGWLDERGGWIPDARVLRANGVKVDDDGAVTCGQCGLVCKTMQGLTAHVRQAHPRKVVKP